MIITRLACAHIRSRGHVIVVYHLWNLPCAVLSFQSFAPLGKILDIITRLACAHIRLRDHVIVVYRLWNLSCAVLSFQSFARMFSYPVERSRYRCLSSLKSVMCGSFLPEFCSVRGKFWIQLLALHFLISNRKVVPSLLLVFRKDRLKSASCSVLSFSVYFLRKHVKKNIFFYVCLRKFGGRT